MPSYSVSESVDILFVQGRVRRYAEELGFGRMPSQELAIVASELTSNILKYGRRGSIEVDALTDNAGTGMTIRATDEGEPFLNLELALLDGYDDQGPIDPILLLKRRGIGGGLGAIVRLTDSFAVLPSEGGKQIIVTRYLKRNVT